MKYLIRLIVVIPWSIIGLVYLFRTWFEAIFYFMKYGGEQITYSPDINKKTILDVYNKLETLDK